jgi:hypothetical protein
MFDRLKNYEFEMDPGRQKAVGDSLNALMGRGTTNNPWEQAPTLPPDPDAEAMIGTQRRLTPVSLRGNNPMGGPQPYVNDLPNPPQQEQIPPGWMPPGMTPPGPPQGDYYQPPPDTMQTMPIPRFHIPPGMQRNTRDQARVSAPASSLADILMQAIGRR